LLPRALTADGGGHLLGALDAQADVAVVVANHHKRLEAGALACPRLLLHRHDLHDLREGVEERTKKGREL
jgi:hypothetical protein